MSIEDGKTVGLGSESEQEPAEEDEDDDLEERVAATVQEVIKAVEQEAKGAAEEMNEDNDSDQEESEEELEKEPVVETSEAEEEIQQEKSKGGKRKRKELTEPVPRRFSQRNLGKALKQSQQEKGPIHLDSEDESYPVPLDFKATLTSEAKRKKVKPSSEESQDQGKSGKSVASQGTLWIGPSFGGGFAGFNTTPVEQQLTMLVKQVELLQEMVQELQTSHRVLVAQVETMAQTTATQHQAVLDKLDELTTEVVEEEVPLPPSPVTTPTPSLP